MIGKTIAVEDGDPSTPAARRTDPEWITCFGDVRSIVDGVVICPRGDLAPLSRCRDCRFLQTTDSERWQSEDCSPEPTASADCSPTTRTWAELVIELL